MLAEPSKMICEKDSDRGNDRIWSCLISWWAVCGLALFCATWRLWIPQSDFPQVPLIAMTGNVPVISEWIGSVVIAGSLIVIAGSSLPINRNVAVADRSGFCRRRQKLCRRAWLSFAVGLSVLILFDQHRLQPWAYLLWLLSIVFVIGSLSWSNDSVAVKERWLSWLRLLTVSVYFWSAWSKLDRGFGATHGTVLVEALFGSVGLDAARWPSQWMSVIGSTLPIGEMLIAVGLCWHRTCRVALWGATSLHLGLLLALGPLGLGHRPGVLIWNIAFIGHDWLLFGNRSATSSGILVGRSFVNWPSLSFTRFAQVTNVVAQILVQAVLCGAMIWPIGRSSGLCDRWLAWSVYSSDGEQVSVLLTEAGQRRLPESAQRAIEDGELKLDRWSLESLSVPIYPQLRFQFGIVEWLRQHCGDESLIEIRLQISSPRLTVPFETERLTSENLHQRRSPFWWNSMPRVRRQDQ